MDDPNITMEEYIRLEEEKDQKRGKVFNCETAKYGKIWCDEDIYDLRSIESEFLAKAFNDKVSSEKTLSCEPTVSSLNDGIDFRVSFDDSGDEDYTGKFLKELRTNTFSGSDHEDANEHIEKVLEIVDLFHIPNITIDQVMLRAFPISLTGVITPSRVRSTETSDGLAAIQAQLNNLGREIKKVNEKVYAAQVGCGDIEHQLQDFYQWNNANLVSRTLKDAYFTCNLVDLFKEEDIEQHLQAKRHEENSNLIKEIRAATDAAIRNQGASIKTLEIQIGKLGYGRVLLVLNKIIRPFLGRLNELNNLNEPFELRRNQEDDLIPSIEEGEVIEEFRARDDELDIGIDDYPILEDIDAYRDDGMGDVIFGEPFLKEVGIKTKWFEGIITLYNSDDEVTYQMVRSHPRFKHTNEQCNKIPPLLKVSEKDEKNGISHAYQKLKGFYKGV
ncbi:hypothetical protein Tco_0966778 [Tanacetum coccineum]